MNEMMAFFNALANNLPSAVEAAKRMRLLLCYQVHGVYDFWSQADWAVVCRDMSE